MIEKRFTISDTDILCMTIIDNETGKCYGFASDIAVVMNELNDENKTFREALKELKEIGDYQAFYIEELQNENTELEKKNGQLKSDRNYWKTLAQSLAKTNGKR